MAELGETSVRQIVATADADALARTMASERGHVPRRVAEIAALASEVTGSPFDRTVRAGAIREGARYSCVRVTMDAQIGTAVVKLRLDVNFGDPISPGPQMVELPSLGPGEPSVRVPGYPIETVLAEKIVTAIELGAANIRVRDFADTLTLTARMTLIAQAPGGDHHDGSVPRR